MTSQSHDLIVAGTGATDSGACSHLARRGLKVLGLDRFDLGLAMGSRHFDLPPFPLGPLSV